MSRAGGILVALLLLAGPVAAQSEAITRPRLLHDVTPERPADASSGAEVVLALIVDVDGHVASAEIVKSAGPSFDDAARAAAGGLVFEPARRGDRAVRARVLWKAVFPAPARRAVPAADRQKPTPKPTTTIEVTGARPVRSPAAIGVSASESARVPGSQGDPGAVIQSLPGVSRPAFGSGPVILWGAAPGASRFYVDGVEIPALFHSGGLRSTIDSDLVGGLAVDAAAYGAEHGRALGGIVRIDTRDLSRKPLRAHADVNLVDASGSVESAMHPRVRVAVSGRYGYLDRTLPALGAPDNVGDYVSIPRYDDWQGKITWDIDSKSELSAVALASHDRVDVNAPSADPDANRSRSTELAFERYYATWSRHASDGSLVRITPWYGFDHATTSTTTGGFPTHLDNRTALAGVVVVEREPLLRGATLLVGFEGRVALHDLSRAGSLTLPPREGDVTVFGEAPGDAVDADKWGVREIDAAPFAKLDLAIGRLSVAPGVRAEAYLTDGTRGTPRIGATPGIGYSSMSVVVEPRLAAAFTVSDAVSLEAAGGFYHQPADAADRSAVFGTPALGLERAEHVSGGARVRITRTLSAELVAFYERMHSLVVRSRRALPALARSLVQDGEGQSTGAQLFVKQELWHGFFGWIGYTLDRSERRYVGDAAWRVSDYDQTHWLTLVASQDVGAWTFGLRFRAATGLPRTPVAGAYYDVKHGRYDPLFGEQNSTRLPMFHELDARVDRRFAIGDATIDLYADLMGLTFHANTEEYAYNFDYGERETITGLPALAIVGVRIDSGGAP